MKFDTNDIQLFQTYIQDCENAVFFVHHNPDGDALGSACCLKSLMITFGKNVTIVAPNECPKYLHFLEGINDVWVYEGNEETILSEIDKADLLVCLDYNKKDRIGGMHTKVDFAGKRTILIDHHPEPDSFVDVMFSDTSVSSTAELVFHILEASGYIDTLPLHGAEALFTGIVTDTGGFSHNCSNANTYLAVAKLMQIGVDRDTIHGHIFQSSTLSRLQLLGNCIGNKMEVFPDLGVAYITISLEDKAEINFESGDSEGIVNYPLTVKGINFCALFTENEDLTKVSFRSKGLFPANKFSEKFFNGGGHLNAAGGRVYKSLDDAIKLFKEGLSYFEDELKSHL